MASASAKPPADPSKPTPKHIANPRRLLILSPPSQSLSIIPSFLDSLTGVPVHDPPQQPPADTTPPESTPTTPSFAGYTTHSPLRLQTKYYTAEVPVWVDEIPLPLEPASTATAATTTSNTETQTQTTSPGQWRTEFLSDEASIVRDAVGAVLICVHAPSAPTPAQPDPSSRADVRALRALIRDVAAVKECIDDERGGGGDVPGLLVLVGAKKPAPAVPRAASAGTDMGLGDEDVGGEDVPFSVAWWEDQLYDEGLVGWEVVEWDAQGQGSETRNEFGEREGMPRIKEVLETHDWSASGDAYELDADRDPDGVSDDGLEEELLGLGRSTHTRGFGQEVNELEREMFGLRMAIERGGGDGDGHEDEDEDGGFQDDDEEIKVESMEALMMRVQAIRDMSSDLPESERKKFAAKAVSDLMREM